MICGDDIYKVCVTKKPAGLHKEAVESGRQNPTVELPRGPRLPRFGERRVRGFRWKRRGLHFEFGRLLGGRSQRRRKTFVNSHCQRSWDGGAADRSLAPASRVQEQKYSMSAELSRAEG